MINLDNIYGNKNITKGEILEGLDVLEARFGERKVREIITKLGEELVLKNLTERLGKDLTSFMAFPDRGEGGSSSWGGNLSPKVVEALVRYCLDWKQYYRQPTNHFKVIDPMGGSGTTKYVCDSMGIKCSTYDLNPNYKHGKAGWNALKDDLNESADLIIYHPPYHDMLLYSGNIWGKGTQTHSDDLSRCNSYEEFIEKLDFTIRKFHMGLRKDGRLAVLVGDYRKDDKFYSIQSDMMKMGKLEAFIVKGQYNCNSDNRSYKKPFIPIVTEYLVVMKKDSPFLIQINYTKNTLIDFKKRDDITLTWQKLVRDTFEELGGKATLKDIYDALRDHPKAKKNSNYEARIRATIYENKDDFEYVDKVDKTAKYKLTYIAA
ncbi:SAM-dependent methyltransferase [Alkaliphilus sp. B6464]|uniref:SAM-dependent methyltransferase n=1 Tax=Alkaliphilus sp. B6464 TaxID=2731219 RepID=UPI001BAA94E9|nr:SAM-dependent methyltransferase [Alkaliphilus sp. B6464]QUH22218.1 SAM-dependent methyltransferase [Alkaliphilus sp. B6464]